MVVALEITLPGVTTSEYDAVMRELGLPVHLGLPPHTDSPNWPKAALSHFAGENSDGLYVVDVWDTRAEFDKFSKERLGPALAKAGIKKAPQIREVELHSNWARHG